MNFNPEKKRYAGTCRGCGKEVSRHIPVRVNKQIPPAARIRCSDCRKTNYCEPEAKTESV